MIQRESQTMQTFMAGAASRCLSRCSRNSPGDVGIPTHLEQILQISGFQSPHTVLSCHQDRQVQEGLFHITHGHWRSCVGQWQEPSHQPASRYQLRQLDCFGRSKRSKLARNKRRKGSDDRITLPSRRRDRPPNRSESDRRNCDLRRRWHLHLPSPHCAYWSSPLPSIARL